MTIWQPIDTAPKDGSPILAYLNETGIRLVCHESPEEAARVYGGKPEEYDGTWVEVFDRGEDWRPRLWAPFDAIPLPDGISLPSDCEVKE